MKGMRGEEVIEIQTFPPDLFYECNATGEQVGETGHSEFR